MRLDVIVFIVAVVAVEDGLVELLLPVLILTSVELLSRMVEEASTEESKFEETVPEGLLLEEMNSEAGILEEVVMMLDESMVASMVLVESIFDDKLLEKDSKVLTLVVAILDNIVLEGATFEDETLEDGNIGDWTLNDWTLGDETVKDLLSLPSRVDVNELKLVVGE